MNSETENVRRKRGDQRTLDGFDRKILGILTKDARQTYAEIGEQVGLSAPAVHERIKRLRANGAIAQISAMLDGPKVGKPLLAFVHIDTEGWGKSEQMVQLARFPEVEELHSVAGDTGVIMKVRTKGPLALEHLLSEVYSLPGVRGTKSYIALSTYLDRPVQADVTRDWPDLRPPTAK